MPYLPETLASIQAQTYHDWEVLAWDNGSTDGTVEVLKEWIPACLPGRVISDKPMGLGASLAEMVRLCRTELCARIDADDVNHPERLNCQIAYLRDHPEVAALGTQMNRLDKDGVNYGLFNGLPTEHDDIVDVLLHNNALAHPTVLFRRSSVVEVGNYRETGEAEDYDLWLRMAFRCRLANLDMPLLNYRVHDKSATQLALRQNRLTHLMNNQLCEHAPQTVRLFSGRG